MLLECQTVWIWVRTDDLSLDLGPNVFKGYQQMKKIVTSKERVNADFAGLYGPGYQKTCLRSLRTTKVQTSLHIRADLSAPFLFAF